MTIRADLAGRVRVSAAAHMAPASAAPPASHPGWPGGVSADTVPAAGATVNPITAQTAARRPAVLARTAITARPTSAIVSAIAAATTAWSPR